MEELDVLKQAIDDYIETRWKDNFKKFAENQQIALDELDLLMDILLNEQADELKKCCVKSNLNILML